MPRDIFAILLVAAILIILVVMLSKRNVKDLKALKDYLNKGYQHHPANEHSTDQDDIKS